MKQRSTGARAIPAEPEPSQAGGKLYSRGLKNLEKARLVEIASRYEGIDTTRNSASIAGQIGERLSEGRTIAFQIQSLTQAARSALALFAAAERVHWPLSSWQWAVRALGADPTRALEELSEAGLVSSLAEEADPTGSKNGEGFGYEPLNPTIAEPPMTQIAVHESVLGLARSLFAPKGTLPATTVQVKQPRDADPIELLLRLSAVWQLCDAAPPRRVQSGALFKRDYQRFEESPTLSDPPVERIEPTDLSVDFWLEAAWSIGLIRPEDDGDRILPARYAFWEDNAFHLAKMAAVSWLAPRCDSPFSPRLQDDRPLRAVLLLDFASLADDGWISLEDLAEELDRRLPDWRGLAHAGQSASPKPGLAKPVRGKTQRRTESVQILHELVAMQAYQLGLVSAAERTSGGGTVFQLSEMGRYALSIGPPPRPKEGFEQFLYVQPNLEIIAYRQGLNARIIGELARFADWRKFDAAIALELSAGSVYRGLSSGLSAAAIEERLIRHGVRPLPATVSDAVRNWSERRDRVAFHPAATLLEFANGEDLEAALELWSEAGLKLPERLSGNLLLVEEEASIPYHALRQIGSRDYRRPIEACLEVGKDGVTLLLDPGRSDLLVNAELLRVADRVDPGGDGMQSNRDDAGGKAFRISTSSLRRAFAQGVTVNQLDSWLRMRTGRDAPPAVRLLLTGIAREPSRRPLEAKRAWILTTPNSDMLDGLMQHPATAPFLSERLGPTTAVIDDDKRITFKKVLAEIGLDFEPRTPGVDSNVDSADD